MADSTLQSQIGEARSAGYTDDQILSHLSTARTDLAPKIAEAQQSGHSSGDVVNFLAAANLGGGSSLPAQEAPAPAEQPSAASRFITNFASKLHPFTALKHYLVDLPLQEQADFQAKMGSGDYGGALGALAKSSVPGSSFIPDVVKSQFHQFVQAHDVLTDTKQQPNLIPRLSEAGGHVAAGLLPVLGPAAAGAGEQIGSGDVAGGLGSGAGVVASVLEPHVMSTGADALSKVKGAAGKIPIPNAVKFAPQLDPAEASAVQYGHDQGVQMPTSVQTGSKLAANAENIAQHLPFSAGIAKTARAAEQSTLAAAGAREVTALDPASQNFGKPPATPLDAGEAIHGQLDKNIAQHHADAGSAYDLLRSIESQPEHTATVQTGTKLVDGGVDEAGNPVSKRVPVLEDLQLPVPLRPVKAALKPIYDRMMRLMPVAQQQASTGLKALSNIVNGPDFESASITDENLGAIKQIARDSNSPVGQGLAKAAVQQLDAAVRATVARAGPDATAALEQGRASTIAKYAAQDVKDSLPSGAVDVANKLTAPGDRNVELLRSVAQQAPDHIPALAQSVVQGLIEKGSADAGMGKPQSALTAWSKIGDETKGILFKGRESALGNYFTLAKKMGENPNPSGSGSLVATAKAGLMLVTQPHIGIPMLLGARALTRILFSPEASRNLILGMKMPAASGQAGAAVSASILKAAGSAAVPATAAAGVSTTPQNLSTSGDLGNGPITGSTGQGAAVPQAAGAGAAPAGSQSGGAGANTGAATTITVPGQPGAGYRASYKLQELGDLNASHSGLTFAPNAKYRLTNDRDYSNSVNQGKVVNGASREAFNPGLHITDNPDATNGPVVTDSAGNVIGGNGRKMILDRVYSGNPKGAAAYREMLTQKAGQFGVDPAAIAGMKAPVLTRVIDDSEFGPAATKQDAVTDMNKTGTAPLTPGERAIADSRRVSTEVLDDVASRLDAKGAGATMADVLQGKSGQEIFAKLTADGVISPQERSAFVDNTTGGLTKAGRERISQMMIGRFFSDPAQLESVAPAVRAKVEQVAAPLAQVEAKGAWSLTSDVQSALDLLHQAKAAGIPNVDDFMHQDGLFGKQKYSAQAVTIAKSLKSSSTADLKAAARQFAQDAAYADKGESLMGDTPTPEGSFADTFGKLKSGAEAQAAKLTAKARTDKPGGGIAVKPATKVASTVAAKIDPVAVRRALAKVPDVTDEYALAHDFSESNEAESGPQIQLPFYGAGGFLGDKLDTVYSAVTDLGRYDDVLARAPVQRVELADLHALQNTVGRHVVEAKAEALAAGKSSAPAVVVQLDGTKYLLDGSHQLTAAHLGGQSAADVKFLNLDDPTWFRKAQAGKKP